MASFHYEHSAAWKNRRVHIRLQPPLTQHRSDHDPPLHGADPEIPANIWNQRNQHRNHAERSNRQKYLLHLSHLETPLAGQLRANPSHLDAKAGDDHRVYPQFFTP
jgi:hypothetical protein